MMMPITLQENVHINSRFSILVGEDCMTRIWDIKNANCLREFQSFRFDDTGEPIKPAVVFLDQTSRSNISSGFLYGIGDELYYYDL